MIDVGGFGKQSDGGTLSASEFGVRLNNGRLDLPDDRTPSGHSTILPHVFVGDEAFPLMRNMMRPYPGKKLGSADRIFNYRLSRARFIVENAFGILASRFRVYHRTMEQRPENVDKIIKATCILHNMFQKATSARPAENDESEFESDNLKALRPLNQLRGYRTSHEAFAIRDSFREYFTSPCGKVPWQDQIL
jgi:hypothetical protein